MNWKLSLTDRPTWRTTALFLLLSWFGIFFVFRGAVWGDRIVAPVDVAAALYSKYQWIDPTLGPIPRNHYVIDMVDYELARVYLAHRSLQAGEFPWWDPYSDGGGPLAAEPHYGLPDPLRLLMYKAFPFVTAYNWTRILQSFLSGLGMFLLLRSLGFAQFSVLLGALSFQFATINSSFVYGVPPQSLPYYCFLWLALAKYMRTRPLFAIGLGAPLCAAIIMSGTQQSHAYLVLFLVCLTGGYGSCFRHEILRIASIAAAVFVLGCALAAPVLIPQIEIFQLSSRRLTVDSSPITLLSGIFSLTGIFPWFTGSFRTVDLSKIFSAIHSGGALAYVLHIGTAALMVSAVGILGGRKSLWTGSPHARTAVLLIILYLVVICSTPLMEIFYNRSGALAVIGLTVMFATGWDLLMKNGWRNSGRVMRWIVLLLSIGVVMTHAFALFVYPRIKDRVLNAVLAREARNPTMSKVPELRRFQIDNLPNEITFKNPEPLLAFLGALCLLGLVKTRPQYRPLFASGVFALNLLPLLLFYSRSVPSSPVEYWHAMLAGGPEQRKVMNETGNNLRVKEKVSDRLDYLFPGTLASLYGVHTLHGYGALRPAATAQTEHLREHNVLYESEWRRQEGKVTLLSTNQVRFVWANRQNRDVAIAGETLNSIRLHIAAGAAGELLRTDTYYPGWRVESPASVTQHRNSDGFLAFSIPPAATDMVLRYEPSWSNLTKPLSLTALVGTGLLLAGSAWRARRTAVHPLSSDGENAYASKRV
jgi:hypothetical protein